AARRRPSWSGGRRFFFQAEDGIRDFHVTGVQTCALPIFAGPRMASTDSVTIVIQGNGGHGAMPDRATDPVVVGASLVLALQTIRSEERRVGKEGRCWWSSSDGKERRDGTDRSE